MANITNVKKLTAVSQEGWQSALTSDITSGATIVTIDDLTGYTDGDTVVMVIDPGNSYKQAFTGVVDIAGSRITGVIWTEGTDVIHNSGAVIVDYVTATHYNMLSKRMQASYSSQYNVKEYGATGDGSTDDSTAIQAATTAAVNAGGGIVFFPAGYTYKIATTITISPATLTRSLLFEGYGAKLDYSGASDAIIVATNVVASVQASERNVSIRGFYITGTSSASSAMRIKATNVYVRDITIEGFTSVATQKASIILDSLLASWVRECHFQNIDIKNTGNGICFISRDESGGIQAPITSNTFSNIHIWLTQATGTGIYGVGLGASTLANISRCTFQGVTVRMINVATLTAFNLTSTFAEGVVFIAPMVEVTGTATTSVGWSYAGTDIVTVLGPSFLPLASVATKFSGAGKYVITGGNVPSTMTIDSAGNITAPRYYSPGGVGDSNLNEIIDFTAIASAVNHLGITNAATGTNPLLAARGDDTNVALDISSKGAANLSLWAGAKTRELAIFSDTASAVNELTIANAATGTKPSIVVSGGDTNAGLDISSKGTGAINLWSGAKARELLVLTDVASAVNQVEVLPAATTAAPEIKANGDDTNVDLQVNAKGTGVVRSTSQIRAVSATATPAGGTAGAGITLGTTSNLGIFFGSGAPSLSAAQGSLYIRSDGSTTATRLYVNTNGTTGWTNVTTAT